jgi:hypothetical protein
VLAFRLNTDDVVLAGPEHPLRVAGTADVPAFYWRCATARKRGSTAARMAS